MMGKETRESWTLKPGSSRAQRWHEFAGHEAASEEGGRVSSGPPGVAGAGLCSERDHFASGRTKLRHIYDGRQSGRPRKLVSANNFKFQHFCYSKEHPFPLRFITVRQGLKSQVICKWCSLCS